MQLSAKQQQELGNIVDVLEAARIRYAVWSGAQAMLLGGHRQTDDVDIWVHDDDIVRAIAMFPGATIATTYDSAAARMGVGGEIDFMGRMNIHVAGNAYPLRMTSLACEHLTEHDIAGRTVTFANPADTVLLKAILQRGPDENKHDLTDIAALCRQPIDTGYLALRILESGSLHRVRGLLTTYVSGLDDVLFGRTAAQESTDYAVACAPQYRYT